MGAVLDPIVAIRCQVTLEPDALVTFDLITGVADTREHCLALVEKYHDRSFANRIFELAWTHGQVLLHQLNISEADAQLYGKLASASFTPIMRAVLIQVFWRVTGVDNRVYGVIPSRVICRLYYCILKMRLTLNWSGN